MLTLVIIGNLPAVFLLVNADAALLVPWYHSSGIGIATLHGA